MSTDYERLFEEAPDPPQPPKAQPLFDLEKIAPEPLRPGFDLFYRDTLLPALTVLEKERLVLREKRKQIWLSGFTVIAASVAAGFWLNLLPLTAVLSAVALLTGSLLMPSAKTDLRGRYKTSIAAPLVKHALGADAQYLQTNGIGVQEFVQTGLWPLAPTTFVSEDFVGSRSDKTPFYFSEIRAEHTYYTSAGKTRRRVTIPLLNGVLFRADFNKHFKGRIVLKNARAGRRLPEGVQIKMLENPDFDQRYVVISDNDPVEVRYLLTPAFMQRLLDLDAQIAADLEFSLVAGSIYIAYYSEEDHFEVGDGSLLDPAQLQILIGRLQRFAGIVETLELNTRIWTKE